MEGKAWSVEWSVEWDVSSGELWSVELARGGSAWSGDRERKVKCEVRSVEGELRSV